VFSVRYELLVRACNLDEHQCSNEISGFPATFLSPPLLLILIAVCVRACVCVCARARACVRQSPKGRSSKRQCKAIKWLR
jgi:hypothetical protein